ncbi:ABC transporter substrate-binding protein [Roseivirga misakiensis]|uniref:Fe/B12 periplasmic-binding domain-containing protein n=1 Tax=Roseivirga misakiensis TaxID=1563681 RepID=A0A1E5T5N4_9BACT|nr:ABC transporter substrate-binding protein [Roseivirga misakiensis]OEK06704.1 hypothetical protein BFP71_03315 [Roseivirga misakiensis]
MKRNKNEITHLRADNTLTWLPVLILAFLVSCTSPKSNSDLASDFDPQKDYFPVKTSIDYAIGFDIVYHKHWKELQMFRHYNDFIDTVKFALVQRDTPAPDGFAKERIVNIPAQGLGSLSTTHLGMFDLLDAFDQLKGVETAQYISNSRVKSLVETGEITELSPAGMLNTELTVSLGIDALLGVGYPNSQNEAYQELENTGVPVLLNADWQEKDLLGRAEWIKLLAVLLNKEALVNEQFADMVSEYEAVLQIVNSNVQKGPSTITGIAQGDSWFVSGGKSFAYHILDLAKVNYPWAGDQSTGSLKLDFETVYLEGLKSDFWLVPGAVKTLDEILQADARYADFKAFKNRTIYNIYGRYTEGGGNDYYESAVVKPHIVLKDNIKIFHPDLLPDHELVYYNRLK